MKGLHYSCIRNNWFCNKTWPERASPPTLVLSSYVMFAALHPHVSKTWLNGAKVQPVYFFPFSHICSLPLCYPMILADFPFWHICSLPLCWLVLVRSDWRGQPPTLYYPLVIYLFFATLQLFFAISEQRLCYPMIVRSYRPLHFSLPSQRFIATLLANVRYHHQ